ncbi:MAG TPA: S41 family peptidase [Clostridia bacterium]|nr:S41 family peptidase [Clostridia bacterium]
MSKDDPKAPARALAGLWRWRSVGLRRGKGGPAIHKDNPSRLRGGAKLLLVTCLVLALLLNVGPFGSIWSWQTEGPGGYEPRKAHASEDADLKTQLMRLEEVLSLLEARFYKPDKVRDVKGMIDAAISGMIFHLGDPYTSYMPPEEYEKVSHSMEGTFGGIGVTIEKVGDYVTIVSVMEGMPAEAAGLKPRDRIVKVQDVDVVGASLDKVSGLIKGPVGTEVRLEIDREGVGRFKVSMKRQLVTVHVVEYRMLEPGIGYLKIKTFNNDNVAKETKEAYEALKSQGLSGLVLDLRNNSGGLLDQAISVAAMFVPPGPILTVKERGRPTRRISHNGIPDPIGLVVLTNEGTASGSEIVAAAIQDRGTGVIVGTTTFGKGLIQTIYKLADGSALKVTTGEYLTAGGRSIQGTGVKPDFVVEDTRPSFVVVKTGEAAQKDAGSKESGSEESASRDKDAQLDAALSILRERIGASVHDKPGVVSVN